MKNYYEELGVEKNADISEIKKAYLSLLKKYHPDIYQGDKNYAQEQTQKLNMIYNILKDEKQRRIYDESAGLLNTKQIVENNEKINSQQKSTSSRRKVDCDGGIFSGLKNRWANAFSYDYESKENSTKNSDNKSKTNKKNNIENSKINDKNNSQKNSVPFDELDETQQKEKKLMTFYVLFVLGLIIGGLIIIFIF